MANTQRITRIPRKPTARARLVTGRNRLVTIAFKRTFLEGPMDGDSIYIKRRATHRTARKLVSEGSSVAIDLETGQPVLDLFIRECSSNTDPLVIERDILIRENAILARMIEYRV